MKRQKSPQEKKALSFAKDHVVRAESYAAHFKTYRHYKALAMRHERRKVHEVLTVAQLADDDAQGDVALRPVRREKVRKFGPVVPLGEAVQGRLQTRIEHAGGRFFHKSYQSGLHREEFAAFLGSLIQGKSGKATALARHFRGYLEPGPPPAHTIEQWYWYHNRRVNCWLQAFFEDEPEWEPRLRAWVERLVEKR